MILPLSSFFYPTLNQVDLLLREFPVEPRRRHSGGLVFGTDPLEKTALGRIARHHRMVLSPLLEQSFFQVETKTRLADLLVGAMAGKAVIRQNGPDLPVEIDRWQRRSRPDWCQTQRQAGQQEKRTAHRDLLSQGLSSLWIRVAHILHQVRPADPPQRPIRPLQILQNQAWLQRHFRSSERRSRTRVPLWYTPRKARRRQSLEASKYSVAVSIVLIRTALRCSGKVPLM